MLGYITLGTNNLAKSAAFYDALAKEIGATRTMETEKFIAWGKPNSANLFLIKPADGKSATVGNGVMAALVAQDAGQVDRIYKLAMSLGGKDEGPPGDRGGGFYAAYFRDLDGNKLVANVSIGIAIAPRDGVEEDQLLKKADLALYDSKAKGRGTYCFFSREIGAA